ncbi:MAG: hypothetical protein NVS9B8_06910 [Candidatus Limnocylindrales bacterium]
MTLRGRGRRPDDWPSSHVRARAALSDRLDGIPDPAEAGWLDGHLAACPHCRIIAGQYATQRLELRALGDRMPQPPRDLWARTAAAIEAEPRFKGTRSRSGPTWSRRRLFAPTVILATALVVAVVTGSLTFMRSVPPAPGASSGAIALATGPSGSASFGIAGPTPIPVSQRVEYLYRDASGDFSIKVANVREVCPATATQPCDTAAPVENHPVNLDQGASTVFGSPTGDRLIVVNDPSSTAKGSISVLALASSSPGPDPTAGPTVRATLPTIAPSLVTPTPRPGATPTPRPSTPPTPTPTPTPTPPPTSTPGPLSPPPSPTPGTPASPSVGPGASDLPSASIQGSPSPDASPMEIAHDVALVGESAAYSPSGAWFAFTARPVDGSKGPDMYVWKVGDPSAVAVTSDHRSVFGSWSGETMVGSTVVETPAANGASARIDLAPASFQLDPATRAIVPLPQAGTAWLPAVDPFGRKAVYWTGSLRPVAGPGFAPDDGRLVLGDWSGIATSPSTSPSSSPSSSPSTGPSPTALNGDQATARNETTIAAGRMDGWDARWDRTGTHLAVWIADHQNPAIGRLSLYTVDPFDGRIDLRTPLLDAQVATAGFSISDGKLVWAEPATDGTTTSGRIQVLAWTDLGVGTVNTVAGPVIVIR